MVGFSQTLKRTLATVAVALFVFSLPVSNQTLLAQQQERTCKVYEPNTPKGVIEIKRVGNLQSSSFPQDFEVEVKNISNKPIYYINLNADFPGSSNFGFHLRYGSRELGHRESEGEFKHPEEKDAPLLPGESTVLLVDSPFRQDAFPWTKDNDAEWFRITSHVRLAFQFIQFGDGTGYIMSDPYPPKK